MRLSAVYRLTLGSSAYRIYVLGSLAFKTNGLLTSDAVNFCNGFNA